MSDSIITYAVLNDEGFMFGGSRISMKRGG